MGKITRKEAIENLETLKAFLDVNAVFIVSDAMKKSIDFAIASLETDETYQLEYERTTKSDIALIRTYGLDEGIRCAMCTNSIKSDRGCDGSCVINKDMYKAVMDAIEKRIQPTTKNDLAVEKTDMIDKSNFSQEQYKTDLQSAYDCGYEQAKNDLGVECVSRADALDCVNWAYSLSDAYQKINELPSVTPQEPFINKPCVSSGVCEHDKQKVLEKIRAEIEQIIGERNLDDYDFCSGLICARKIIDKYKAESEE